jgi:glycosyltransferase involved in cell wall biosynthesis
MQPFISIIVPCYNEQATIRFLLDAILAQTYPRERLEVVLADGLSQDKTREVAASFQQEHPDLELHVVDNRRRTIPSGLNLAIREARGEVIIRLDAHSVPIPEYVERCVRALADDKGANVGGVWEIRPGGDGWIPEAIALAAAHPLGVGDALYRLTAPPGAVDTVPFGAFRRQLIDQIGGFDETLLSNEDYEFNARVRRAGGRVWLDPQIRSVYFARASLPALAKQYWRYGFWKLRMLLRYPRTLRWRQALPPLLVGSLIGLALLSYWQGPARMLLALELLVYGAVLVAAGLAAALRRRKPILAAGLAAAIATMHLAWGSGFLWSLASTPLKRNRE